jgi:Peptidase A4 family
MSRPETRVGFTYDEQALRQKFPHHLIATNVKGVYAIPAPPDDFDPNKASEADLVKNGIHWRRPAATDNPALVKAWQRFFARKWIAKDRIVPHLAPQVGKTHVLRKPLRRQADGNYLGPAWAGAGFQGGSWSGVIGNWVVPSVSKPSEPQGDEGGWNSASWIGIDGFDFTIDSNDVLQAGIQQKVDATGQASYVAWFEWYAPGHPPPAYIYTTNFENFPVGPGQNIFCLVVLFPNAVGTAIGIILFANETTGQHVSLMLLAPPGAMAQGNTVEWVMEAPDFGEPNSSLPSFTPVVFTSAVASNFDNTIVGNPENAETFNIERTPGGQVLTSVTVGNETVTINFIG